jgi:hypothetical protein
MAKAYTVTVLCVRGFKVYYGVSENKQHPVTVRVGAEGVFACMTCHKIDCEHARAAKRYAEEHPDIDSVPTPTPEITP